jgi:site-specific DNA-methyltransferase (adenine-specific)
MLRKGCERTINNCGTSDILSIPLKRNKDNNGNNIHDSEKPVRLMEVLIENSSNEGEIVLEPFMGSGTTAIACKNLNRHCIGIEIDETYYNIADKRIKEAQQQITLF